MKYLLQESPAHANLTLHYTLCLNNTEIIHLNRKKVSPKGIHHSSFHLSHTLIISIYSSIHPIDKALYTLLESFATLRKKSSRLFHKSYPTVLSILLQQYYVTNHNATPTRKPRIVLYVTGRRHCQLCRVHSSTGCRKRRCRHYETADQ